MGFLNVTKIKLSSSLYGSGMARILEEGMGNEQSV